MPEYTSKQTVSGGPHHPSKNPYLKKKYKKKSHRSASGPKGRKTRKGSPASNYKPKSSAASFFSALAIKK